ncbi:hypothetical protein DMH02_000620 [Streptomyces sp. WAC 00631]|uniref:hypothetical protein n=1 Tax=Streptomyces sp. WAC 00631 TaxID=2203201 RepID=UPI000F77CC55|nr:hypothetical protein [Streptomyces sp. WAC 00631]MCC5031806.1 hypothetical protein [Streptomyces sp. WAC 00631]
MKTAMVRGKRAATMTAVALVAAVSSGVSAAASLPEGGAEATGGSGVAEVAGQDTALNGRQNNACGNVPAFPGMVFDGRSQADCAVADRSERTAVLDTAGGATATGGDGAVYQQNTAERGRQNNACGNHNSSFGMSGTTDADCTAADASWSRGVVHRGDGAAATGGDGGAYQQNTAQEGRQNNSCGNTNNTTVSGAAEADCAANDASASKGVVHHDEGAAATGGDSVFGASTQDTAQEGRQNNSCGNINLGGTPGETDTGCTANDASVSRGVVHRGGGAAATGGDSGFSATAQNTAQEGRQNNSCGNANTGSLSGTAEADCAAVDASVSRGVTRHSGGATANGGSGLSTLFQQNTAQDGRQNNVCGNTNGLALDSGRTQARCSTVDTSTENRTGSGRVGR